MKAFIFFALVAAVAARGLDLESLRLIRERSLLNQRPVVDDLLLKEKLGGIVERLPLEKSVVGDFERVVPVEQQRNLIQGQDLVQGQRNLIQGENLIRGQNLVQGQRNLIQGENLIRGENLFQGQRNLIQGQDVLEGIYNVDQVLTLEEIYNTELFREYLSIPLFREYIQYPIFQRYVSSVYFQRFWQIPTFRQYFVNPILFYKYIYPIVQLFQNEYTLPTIRGQEERTYGQDVLGRQTLEDLIVRNRNVLPYVYGQQQEDVYNRYSTYGLPQSRQSVYGQEYYPTYTQGVNYKFLLERIYRNLLQRQPVVEPVTEVKTDVKVLPQEKVVVSPITGERVVVDEPRIVDVKVNEQILPVERQQILPVERQQILPVERQQIIDQVLPIRQQLVEPVVDREQLIREQLLKELVKEKYITPEVYENIRDVNTIRREGRQIYNPLITRRDQGLYTPSYLNRYVQQDERVNLYNNLYNQLYNTEIPAIRENTRLPIEQLLGNIVA